MESECKKGCLAVFKVLFWCVYYIPRKLNFNLEIEANW